MQNVENPAPEGGSPAGVRVSSSDQQEYLGDNTATVLDQAPFEQTETCSKKVRGKARRSLDLIEAMRLAAEAAQPITGRGIGYKLFTAGLIPSMARSEMQRVYRLLKEAREQGDIPWEWIVDQTRSIERVSTWDDPEQYARCVARSYRRDFWNQQPGRCQVWSEKGTVRGVLQPVLDQYAEAIKELIEPVAWKRCEIVNQAEQESLKSILEKWKGAP